MQKTTLGIVIVLFMALTYFFGEMIAKQTVEAEKRGEQISSQPSLQTNAPKQMKQKNYTDQNNTSDKEIENSNMAIKKRENIQAAKQTKLETGKVVYLTFDDGPHPTASAKIMELLEQYHAKATYFMLEPNIKRHPEIIKAMKDQGHTIGVHGVTHEVSKIYQSPDSFISEMTQAIHRIKETVGLNTHLIRAPYGSKPYLTAPFKKAIDHKKLILWDWNIDSEDWKLTSGGFVQKTIHQVNNLVDKEPLVVLMHEKSTTAAHLEELLRYFQDNGYEMKTINASMLPIQF